MKINLVTPIKRGTETITEIALTKPNAGSLRGIKLTNLLQMDFGTLAVLLPRITQPALTPDEIEALDPADLMSLAGEVVAFFMNPAQVQAAREQATLN
jgi:hypothetical protein